MQLERDVGAEILIYAYFPNEAVGSCGSWSYGPGTKFLKERNDSKNFKEYWKTFYTLIEGTLNHILNNFTVFVYKCIILFLAKRQKGETPNYIHCHNSATLFEVESHVEGENGNGVETEAESHVEGENGNGVETEAEIHVEGENGNNELGILENEDIGSENGDGNFENENIPQTHNPVVNSVGILEEWLAQSHITLNTGEVADLSKLYKLDTNVTLNYSTIKYLFL